VEQRVISALPIEFGNLEDLDTNGTGWFIGFSDWCKHGADDLRYSSDKGVSSGLCVKWFSHSAGDPAGQNKPISTGRTMSILISNLSEFRLDFSFDTHFPLNSTVSKTLKHMGDYAIWGPGIFHRAYGMKPATIITIRWEPGNHSD